MNPSRRDSKEKEIIKEVDMKEVDYIIYHFEDNPRNMGIDIYPAIVSIEVIKKKEIKK